MSIKYWKKYYDVDYDTIKTLLRQILQPMNSDIGGEIDRKPEIFSPFWIGIITCILIFFTTNINHSGISKPFHYGLLY